MREQSAGARELLDNVSRHVRREDELFELVAWLAEFREHAAERMLALTDGGDRRRLLARSRQLRKTMARIYGRFMDTADYPHQEAALFGGEETLLGEKAK